MISKKSPLTFPLLFIVLTVLFGSLFLYVTPPFEGADERNHLGRAYAISTGELTPATEGDRRGGQVPVNLLLMREGFWNVHNQANPQTKDSLAMYANMRLVPQRTQFLDYPNTAVYPWPVYVPAAAGLVTARLFDLSVLNTLRAARWAGLLFWIVSGAIALWTLPTHRAIFTALLLLPMTVWTHATVSADTFTNSIAILVLAYILRLAYGKGRIVGRRELAWLFIAALCMATAKLVYTPILLTALLIPSKRFSSYGGKWLAALAVSGLALCTMMYWAHKSDQVYLPYVDYHPEYRWRGIGLTTDANVRVHKEMVINAPYRLFRAVGNGLVETWSFYAFAYVGVLGWLDIWFPRWVYYFAYIYIFLIALTEKKLAWTARLLHFFTVAICFLLVSLSQMLSWEAVGTEVVMTAQGRYLVPFAPLFFLLFSGFRLEGSWRKWLVGFGGLGLLTTASFFVWVRYWA